MKNVSSRRNKLFVNQIDLLDASNAINMTRKEKTIGIMSLLKTMGILIMYGRMLQVYNGNFTFTIKIHYRLEQIVPTMKTDTSMQSSVMEGYMVQGMNFINTNRVRSILHLI